MIYDINGIEKIININYPSIRNCINLLQDLKYLESQWQHLVIIDVILMKVKK